ncbi:AI-2E family transporter [Helicobacter fennelliae]|uniref:Membrane Protein-Predicted permease n=2 Tax=Helicobacter fennelliae TaxID=215 RepID=T1CY85_9HELI|nr:AI-2E family transporter [Helicobacter fennelliae]GAD18900.1 membrane Protein-Predicted permease [Helicobacter fennelliae MRY12-0050]SQB98403.1 acid membrane antigen A [Helicobacter fennelliae]STP08538.1 acid membrane antigen A [Helicobacter fennelliae]STQ84350.1 acid membrane antigen A [Helicobacter fennelliae]
MNTKVFFGIVFCIALYLMGVLYYSFLYDIVVALLLCIATYWIKNYFDTFIKNEILTSILSVCALLMIVLIPLYFIIYRGILSLSHIKDQTEIWIQTIKHMLITLNDYFPFLQIQELTKNLSFSSIASYATSIGTYIGKGSVNFTLDFGFIVIFLFVFFLYGRRGYVYIKKLLPFQEHQINQIALDVSGVLRIVFFSTILNVLLQGFAFGIAAHFLGLDGILLGILYGFCSMIPVVGGVLVWLPCAFFLYTQSHIIGAIFLALYSLIFIGFFIDNIIKPFLIGIVNRKLLTKPLQINEFIIFFAIFAGLGAFGFWGIVIGPAITAFFIVMLRIYERDFAPIHKQK